MESPLGDGKVDLPTCIDALKTVGFDGYLTIERETGKDPISDIKQTLKTLRTLL